MNGASAISTSLPRKLFEIGMDDECFTLSCVDIVKAERGGLSAEFEASYRCSGMDCTFAADLTLGNLHAFYFSLDNALDGLPGTEPNAILQSYAENRTKLTFSPDRAGHWRIRGRIQNKDNGYRSAVLFEMKIYSVFVPEIYVSLRDFFKELERRYGNNNFY